MVFVMDNESFGYHLTWDEIKCVQEHGDGWEIIWGKICAELLERLGRIIDDDDFTEYIMMEYHLLVKRKRLFHDFDPNRGDIYGFLCNPVRIRQMYSRYIKTSCPPKTFSVDESHDCSFPADVLPSEYRDISETIREKLESLCSCLFDEELTLNLPGRIDRVSEYAGLQLYQRLDRSVESIKRLIKHVNESVGTTYRCNESTATNKIKSEHREAEKSIQNGLDEHYNELFDKGRNRPRDVNSNTERDIRRKLTNLIVRRSFYPLITGQIMRLLGLTQNNAEQIHCRYKARLASLLPLSEEDRRILIELDILNVDEEEREGEENDA